MNGSATTEIALDNSVSDRNDQIVLTVASDTATLGLNTVTTQVRGGAFAFFGSHIASPIHTSSHYQTFETPFLHELVGGDRNMEQTNLVVTPDGKTWDEVTRDVGYIGGQRVLTNATAQTTGSGVVIFDDWRGSLNTDRHYFNKGFAIAYDRLICLENGNYIFSWICYDSTTGGQHTYIYINGNYMVATYKSNGTAPTSNGGTYHTSLKRGDYVQMKGLFGYDGDTYNGFNITKV
jgi:hypothetical protein